jgi:hypothetical protein
VVEASVLEVAVVPDVFVVPTVPDVTVDAVVGSVAASPQEQTSKQTAIIRHISFSTFLFIRNLLIISLFFTDTFYHFIHQKAIEPQNIGFFLFFQQFRKVFYVKNVVNQKKKWYN